MKIEGATKEVAQAKAWVLQTTDPDYLFDIAEYVTVQSVPVKAGVVHIPNSLLTKNAFAGLIVTAPHSAIQVEGIWPVEGKPVTKIKLTAPATFKGRLQLPDGKPAVGLKLKLISFVPDLLDGAVPVAKLPLPVVTTDAKGNFTFKQLPQNSAFQFDVMDERYARLDTFGIGKVGSGVTTQSKPYRLANGGRISGSLVTLEGKPIQGAPILAYGIDIAAAATSKMGVATLWYFTRTDQNGQYTFPRIAKGLYEVTADTRGAASKHLVVKPASGLELKDGQTFQKVDLTAVNGQTLTGRVLDENGKPRRDVEIKLTGPTTPSGSRFTVSCLTDGDGRYRFKVLPGEQSLLVIGGFAEEVTVGSDPVTMHDLKAPRG